MPLVRIPASISISAFLLILMSSSALALNRAALTHSSDRMRHALPASRATVPAPTSVPEDAYWSDSFARPGLDVGDLLSLQVYGSNLYLAGRFRTLDGQPADNIMKWDGVAWSGVGGGVDPGPTSINSLTVYGGRLVVAGQFTSVGGVSVTNIAAWNGTAWAGDIPGLTTPVDEITVIDGVLHAANYDGVFRLVAGTWVPVGNLTGGVEAIVKYGSDLIVAGSLTLGGQYINVARWNGSAWSNIGDASDLVTDAIVHGGEVIVSGWFYTMNGVSAYGVAAWNGSSWHGLGSGIGDPFVEGLSVSGVNLVACGFFSESYGAPATGVAEWNGTGWTSIGGSLTDGAWASAAASFNGELCVAGTFSGAGTAGVWDLAGWNGTTWRRLGPDKTLAVDGTVRAFTNWENRLVMGGVGVHTAGSVTASGVAMLDGGLWSPLGSGVEGSVLALTPWGSDLVVAGAFQVAGGVPANRIARWDGADWTPFGEGFNGAVRALTTLNGDLIAGGEFTASGATLLNRIARWDGVSWQPYGNGFNGYVYSLTAYRGNLIAAGAFTVSGATGVNRIARWTGSAWEPLGAGTNQPITSMTVFGPDLFVGGSFTQAGFASAPYVAYWDNAGWHSVATDFGSLYFALPFVTSVVAAPGRIYVGGRFSSVNSVPAQCLAVWDGANWSGLGSGADIPFDGFTSEVVVHQVFHMNGSIFAGGRFVTAGAKPALNMSIWTDPTQVGVPETLQPTRNRLVARSAPNPFRSSTNILYVLPEPGPVRVTIHDVSGREVAVLDDQVKDSGRHRLSWDGTRSDGGNAPAGVYFARITAGGATASVKLLRVSE